jgi:phage shock protein C
MKKLHRSQSNKVIAGVLGGLAETYELDPKLVRLITLLLCLLTAIMPFVVVYIVAWIIVPKD